MKKVKLASFKADQRPYRSSAANHVGAAVFAHVARSRRSEPLLDERSFSEEASFFCIKGSLMYTFEIIDNSKDEIYHTTSNLFRSSI